jgi:hypothetical protein
MNVLNINMIDIEDFIGKRFRYSFGLPELGKITDFLNILNFIEIKTIIKPIQFLTYIYSNIVI